MNTSSYSTPCLKLLSIAILALCGDFTCVANEPTNEPTPSITETEIPDSEKLVVMWTSGDRDVALKMVFMYTFNAKRFDWWKDITLIVWGPSAKLLTEDAELQEYLKKIQESGTPVIACKACADQYGVSEELAALDVTVEYAGDLLTNFIKSDRHLITF